MRVLLAVFLAASALCCRIHAQDAPAPDPHTGLPMAAPDIPPGPEVRVNLLEGVRAPFQGILFDPPTAVRWTNQILWLRQRLLMEHQLHLEIEAGMRQSYEAYVANATQSYQRELAVHATELERTRSDLAAANARLQHIQEHPHRGFAIGFG